MPDITRQHDGSVVRALHALMQRCPDDSIAIRKDVLQAMKTLLSSDFKRNFSIHLNDILDEHFLLGSARHPQLRSLAFSTLADFVNQIKDIMNVNQIVRVIHIFSLNIHDRTLTVSLQTTSVRLLVTMIERITHFQLVSQQVLWFNNTHLLLIPLHASYQ